MRRHQRYCCWRERSERLLAAPKLILSEHRWRLQCRPHHLRTGLEQVQPYDETIHTTRVCSCAVACLDAFGNATAWRAVLAFWEVPATPRARLLAALASYYDDVAKRRTAGDPHFTSRRGRDALRARAAAIDAEQFSGWFAGSGWCRGGVT